LAFSVQCQQIAKIFSEIPEGIDGNVDLEVCLVRMGNGNVQD
jgi:hypothetical protein